MLKIAGLVIDGGYVFDYQPESTQAVVGAGEPSTFQPAGPSPADVTGSVHETPKETPKETTKAEASKPVIAAPEVKPDGVVVYPEQNQPVSASERAILERLQARRQELDARAREIDIRESLLKAAEKRIEARVEEMKAVEARVATATTQKTEADAARFKGIITMYEAHEAKGRRQGVRPARDVRAVRNRFADRAAQDVRYPGPDGSRNRPNGSPPKWPGAPARTNPPTRCRTPQNRRQDAAAEVQLNGAYLTSP